MQRRIDELIPDGERVLSMYKAVLEVYPNARHGTPLGGTEPIVYAQAAHADASEITHILTKDGHVVLAYALVGDQPVIALSGDGRYPTVHTVFEMLKRDFPEAYAAMVNMAAMRPWTPGTGLDRG